MSKTVDFDGACPFLTCLKKRPHSHPVCPTCGSVWYGNFACPTCREHRPEIEQEILDDYAAAKAAGPHVIEGRIVLVGDDGDGYWEIRDLDDRSIQQVLQSMTDAGRKVARAVITITDPSEGFVP